MKYGAKPKVLGTFEASSKEMFFYQYLPIKMSGEVDVLYEERLRHFHDLIVDICLDFARDYGFEKFLDSYVYLSAKNMFVAPGKNYNRDGWHGDGFLTDDVNYVWSDRFPTDFVLGEFDVIQDDRLSLEEFTRIGGSNPIINYPNNSILRMDQYVIHKCGDITEPGMRQFVKLSFSKDKYDLIGNCHNYLFHYDWDMRQRSIDRNVPQKL